VNNNYTFDVFGTTDVLRNLVAELGVKQLSTNTKPMSLSNKYCCKLACNISHGCNVNVPVVKSTQQRHLIILNKEISSVSTYSTQSTPRVVQMQSTHTNSQQHTNGHVTHSSSSSSHRAQRKNVISCVTVGDSDGEASPNRTHGHIYQHLSQHPQHQQTTQLIKHEPQQQHHVSR